MKRLLTVCLLTLAASAASAQPIEGLLAPACEYGNGVSVCTATERELSLVVVRAPGTGFFPDIMPIDGIADVESLFGGNRCAEAPASIIGGYYEIEGSGGPRPVGLIVSEGAAPSRWADWRFGGAIVVDPELNTEIRYGRDLDAARGLEAVEALQSTPILVNNNANDSIASQEDQWNRVAFGLTDGGDLALIGVFAGRGAGKGQGPTLAAFADLIAGLRFPDGATIERAINLDGGPSANLYIRATDRLYGQAGDRYVPSIVCLASRSPR